MSGEEIRNILLSNGFTLKNIASSLGLSPQAFNSRLLAKEIKLETLNEICKAINKNLDFFMGENQKGEVENITDVRLMLVSMVSQYAYAGYLSGFADETYLDSLPKIPFIVDELNHKGKYVCFEVRGDSMNDGTEQSILEGDRLLCRELKPDLWQNKLHYKKWDFVIVHRMDGILIKRIINHDTETGDITIHSLNDMYEDRVINLSQIAQLFNVIEISRPRRR